MTLIQRIQPRWLRAWRAERPERYFRERQWRYLQTRWAWKYAHIFAANDTRKKFHLPNWTPKN